METADLPVNRAIAIAVTMNHEEERHSWPHLASRTEARFIMNLVSEERFERQWKETLSEDDRNFEE